MLATSVSVRHFPRALFQSIPNRKRIANSFGNRKRESPQRLKIRCQFTQCLPIDCCIGLEDGRRWVDEWAGSLDLADGTGNLASHCLYCLFWNAESACHTLDGRWDRLVKWGLRQYYQVPHFEPKGMRYPNKDSEMGVSRPSASSSSLES